MDYTQLLNRMRQKGLTKKAVAAQIGENQSHFLRKLSGEFEFRQGSIVKLIALLDIPRSEIGDYFFTPKVAEHQQERS